MTKNDRKLIRPDDSLTLTTLTFCTEIFKYLLDISLLSCIFPLLLGAKIKPGAPLSFMSFFSFDFADDLFLFLDILIFKLKSAGLDNNSCLCQETLNHADRYNPKNALILVFGLVEIRNNNDQPDSSIIAYRYQSKMLSAATQKRKREENIGGAAPSWYEADSVSAHELQILCDLFTSSAFDSAGIADAEFQFQTRYKQVREAILNEHRRNSLHCVTATSTRQYVAGDATLIIRVHRFLRDEGMLNVADDSSGVVDNAHPASVEALRLSWRAAAEEALSVIQSSALNAYGLEKMDKQRLDQRIDDWTEQDDVNLNGLVLSCQGNWDDVAAAAQRSFESCLQRYLQYNISKMMFSSGAEAMLVTGNDRIAPIEGSSEEKALELGSLVLAVQKLATAALGSTQATAASREPMQASTMSAISQLNAHARCCVSLTLAAVSACAAKAAEKQRILLRDLLQEYMELRGKALLQRLQLLSMVEQSLQLEERNQLSDRREIALLRVINSFNPAQT